MALSLASVPDRLSGQTILGDEYPGEVTARVVSYFPAGMQVLSAESRLVSVGVVVRDKDGRPVPVLKAADFEILDNGKKRDISSFTVRMAASSQSPAAAEGLRSHAPEPANIPGAPPRYLILLLDDLNSTPAEFRPAQVAASMFVRNRLQENDHVAVYSTAAGPILGFSSDAAAVRAAIDGLRAQPRTYDDGYCPRIGEYEAYVIANRLDNITGDVKVKELFECTCGRMPELDPFSLRSDITCQDMTVKQAREQVFLIANRKWMEARVAPLRALNSIHRAIRELSNKPGSRSLLLTSGGFLSAGLELEQNGVLDAALAADIVINSLDAKGLYTTSLDASQRVNESVQGLSFRRQMYSQTIAARNDTMGLLANGTGGKFFQGNNDLNAGIRALLSPEVTYHITFAPGGEGDGQLHKLTVRLANQEGYSVQARPAYFSAKADDPRRATDRRIDKELLSASSSRQLPVTLKATPGPLRSGGTGLTGVVHINVKDMPFFRASRRDAQRINFIVALIDRKGEFIAGNEGIVDLTLKGATHKDLAKRGIGVHFVLEAPPGAYALRFVASDEKQKYFTALSDVAVIPSLKR